MSMVIPGTFRDTFTPLKHAKVRKFFYRQKVVR